MICPSCHRDVEPYNYWDGNAEHPDWTEYMCPQCDHLLTREVLKEREVKATVATQLPRRQGE